MLLSSFWSLHSCTAVFFFFFFFFNYLSWFLDFLLVPPQCNFFYLYAVTLCDVCIQFMYLNSQCFFYHINVQAVVLNSCGHLIWKSQMPVILVMLELLERSIVLELSAVWLIKGPLRVVTDLTCFSITRHGMAEILLNEFCTPLATV